MARGRFAATLAITVMTVTHLAATGMPAQDAGGIVQKFLAYPTAPHSYRAERRIDASGGGLRGWIEAETDYTPASGFRYTVTDQGGSGIIRSRVLVPLLEEERQLIARGATGTVAISPLNYTFTAQGTADDGLARIGLQALRNERALINGAILVKPDDGELVRLDGKLAKNPSFWTKRVDVVRLYERVGDTVMPVSLESTAQLRLFGRSTLRMTYHYLAIDGRPVVNATR